MVTKCVSLRPGSLKLAFRTNIPPGKNDPTGSGSTIGARLPTTAFCLAWPPAPASLPAPPPPPRPPRSNRGPPRGPGGGWGGGGGCPPPSAAPPPPPNPPPPPGGGCARPPGGGGPQPSCGPRHNCSRDR